MKRLTLIATAVATLAAAFSVRAADANWKQGGSGPFTDPSHWRNGTVPTAGNAVSFQGTTDAVVDDDAMALFVSFSQIQLQGTATRLTINNTTNVTIRKGNTWFVSDGIVKKIGAGTLTLDHALSTSMISVYGGFEVRAGTLAFVPGNSTMTPACPIGVFSPGVLALSADQDVQLIGLYGDGIVQNPNNGTRQIRFSGGSRESPYEFSGTFETYPVKYLGQNSHQRFLNPEVLIGGNQYAGYLGTATFPSCVLRNCCEYEYLGSGETTTSSGNFFMNNGATQLILNGGTNGALNVAQAIYYNSDTENSTYVGEIVWTGDSAQTNVFSGKQSVSGSRPVYWKKTGTGTWRFPSGADRGNAGVVATEKGRLEYDDMAEAGSMSPLGTASKLYSEYHGAPVDETKRVSYAYLLGDGTNIVDATTATMAYIGETAKTIKTRPVALKGAGRFESTTAKLDWTGFTSATTGTNTLVLAGAAAGCVARDVTNGVGKVAVVKEGTGNWSLDGNYDCNACVEVRGGTLTLKDANYEWYRLSLMENYCNYDYGDTGTPLGQRKDHDGTRLWLTGFGLFDAQGENLITNLTVNASANANPSALAPGEAAFGHTDFNQMGSGTTYQLANLFAADNTPFGGNRNVYPPALDNPASWLVVVVRMRTGSAVPTAYDLKSYGRTSWTAGFVRDVRSWKLEGSKNGVDWTELHRVVSNETKEVTSSYNWYSSDTAAFSAGYGISGTATEIRPASLDCVAVAEGATLRSMAPQTVTGIRYDAALGGGTLDGFAFAANGTIEVVNHVRGTSWTLPLETVNCTGSVSGWKVVVDGREKTKYTAHLTDAGIEILPPGLIFLVR